MHTHTTRNWAATTVALLALTGTGCGLEPIEEGGGEDMIPAEVQAALDESCATSVGCHGAGAGQVVLEGPDSVAILESSSSSGGRFVVLGDLDGSYVAQKILGAPGISGGKMPPSPQSDNDEANTQIILDWIAEGTPAETGGDGDPGDGDGDPGDGDGDPEPDCYIDTVPDTPGFEADIWPIIEARCGIPGCHGDVTNPMMIGAMGTYDTLVSMPAASAALNYIEPGSADDSYLWHKLLGTQSTVMGGGGGTMPFGPEPCPDEFQAIYAWITTGAAP